MKRSLLGAVAQALLAYCLLAEQPQVVMASASTVAKSSSATKPNILFFMSDDQDLLMNSMDYMPNLQEKIARQGTTFSKHYCTTALCCPSRTSLFTGKCVHNANVTDVTPPYGAYPKFISQGLNDDYLPLWLQAGGVSTYYVGKFTNGLNTSNYRDPALRGWNSSNILLEPGCYDYLNSTWTLDNQDYQSFPGQNAIDVVEQHAMSMLHKAVSAGGPWFLTIAPAVPHVGITTNWTTRKTSTYYPIPQQQWANAFSDAIVPRTPNWNPVNQTSGASFILNMPYQNKTVVEGGDELYRARLRCVAGLDVIVDKLITALDGYGVLDNTHVVYTTDNGYHIGQHRLGSGKKAGFETDINIPMVWRGPGVSINHHTSAVSTHTDLAPTFLSLFGLPLRTNMDGRVIADIRPNPQGQSSNPTEHVNVEQWAPADPYEVAPFKAIESTLKGLANNTYKGLRIQSDDYSLYYSVWCTNEHELYDMVKDPYQTLNLLPQTYDIATQIAPDRPLLNRTMDQVVARLDALMMVLKSCVGVQCTQPWAQLHPGGGVSTLAEALNGKYDGFYGMQPKVGFAKCVNGYVIEYEGPQSALQYNG